VREADGAAKQAVSSATGGRHGKAGGGDDGVQREGSGVVAGDGGAPANFSSSLTASITKSSGL
jgi:hypothetical protein